MVTQLMSMKRPMTSSGIHHKGLQCHFKERQSTMQWRMTCKIWENWCGKEEEKGNYSDQGSKSIDMNKRSM